MKLLLASLSPSILLLVVAVLIVLLFALIMVLLWRTKKKPAGEEATSADPEATGAEVAPDTQQLARPGPQTETGVAVSSAVRFVRENSAGLGGRYRTPWYLVVGASASGKSTLLEHSGISLSLREGATDFGVPRGLQWRFFDAGVILDVPGEFFLRADHLGSEERSFKVLLRNLVKHRPQRPIDGVVLTIPCTELVGAAAVSPAVIGQRAAQIFDKLWQIEKWVGLCFPVYVIVTKCDSVPGFTSLARQLPLRYRRQMFGWSSSYNLEAAFEPGWVDQGFDEVARELNRLQSEVFVENQDIADLDDMFLFSSKLQELRKPLRIYLGQIFKHSAYRESLQFRGFYFVGDMPDDASVELLLPQATAGEATSYSASEPPADHLVLAGDVLGLTPAPPTQPKSSPIFVTDLFETKIFPERGLARPVSGLSLSRSRWVLGTQAACLMAVVLLVAGVWIRYSKLVEARNEYVPMLDKVYEELTKIKSSTSTQLTPEEEDSANYLVHTVQSTSGGFRTIFYPTSLVAPIEGRLQRAMVPVFQELVLKSFRQQLLRKAELLDSQKTGPCPNESTAGLAQVDSYQQVCAFAAKLQALEENMDVYNTVSSKDRGNVHQLARLEGYLSGHEMDENLREHTHSFDLALAQAAGEPIHWEDVNQNNAANAMRGLTQNLFEQWFSHNPVFTRLDTIRDKIEQLDEPQTAADLIALEEALKEVKANASNPEFAWMAGSAFQLTPELSAVTSDVINKSRYFLVDQRDSLQAFVNDVGKSEFHEFLVRRDGERTQLTGRLLRFDNGPIQLADNAEKLRAYLEELLKQPFAQRDHVQEIKARGADQQLIWNKDLLQEATGLEDQYQRFMKEELADAPPELQEAFQSVALGRLEDSALELVAEAEKLETLPESDDTEISTVPELQSFQNAAPELNSLLAQFNELGLTAAHDELLRVTVAQASSLLLRIDASFEAQVPYASSRENFDRWNGENTAVWAGFDLHSTDEVSQYVLFQRQQVQQYAAKAGPLVGFLETRVAMGAKDPGRTVGKWRGIIDDLQKFGSKAPGTALASLEDFIGVEIDKATPENCQTSFLTNALAGGNYFVQRQEALRRSLYSRCRVVSEQNALREYAGIAKLFNSRLAGKFPFAVPPQDQIPNEADPDDIVQLYGMLDSYGKSIRAGLEKGSFGGAHAQILAFLNQMDGVRPLFSALLAGQTESVPTLDFIPVFRVNQGREINGNQIIDWTLQVGAQTFHNREPERVGRWNFGDPVKLVLRWAKDSPEHPAPVHTPTDTKLASRSVVFEYRDSWSLLSMISLHRPAPNDFDRMVDPEPQTLVFTVADTASSAVAPKNGADSNPQTKVFVRIRLRPPGKPDNLRLRPFPTEAPDVNPAQAQATSAEGAFQ